MRWVLCASLLAVWLASIGAATDVVSQQAVLIRIDALDSSQFPRIQATVTVLDASGRPVVNLPPDAFRADAGSATLPVTDVASATDEGLGIAATLAFDVSGSMEGLPIEQAKEAGKALVGQLGLEDQVAILTFADEVQVVQPFTRSREALASAIDRLTAGGNTALYEAVSRSFETAQTADSPRRAVVLLSDGHDYGHRSQVDRAASLAAARQASVPLFVVGLGDLIDQPYLDELAGAARGQLLLAPGPEALQALYQTLGSVLRHQYVLTLDGSALAGRSRASLRITVAYSGATAATEAGLELPPPPAAAPPPAVLPTAEAAAPPVNQTEEPAGAAQGGFNGLLVAVVSAAAAAASLVVALLWWRGRRRDKREGDAPRQPASSLASAPIFPVVESPTQSGASTAWLRLISVSGGQTYELSDSPVTIGFTSDCGIHLPDGASTPWERVRVWRRDGRYMLHNLSRLGGVSIGGRPITWAVLEDGDEIRVGRCTLVFHAASPPDGDKF